MPTFLFDDIIFGPVKSRRFGVSLGVNLLPETMKYCSFNCVYCECGLTAPDQEKRVKLYTADEIEHAMKAEFEELLAKGIIPDSITFAGNGEPTIHPAFARIIDFTLVYRDEFFPKAIITVLSNATMLHRPDVVEALGRIENSILKLDAGTEQMYRLINRPNSTKPLSQLVDDLVKFPTRKVIQTLFLRGWVNEQRIDNTGGTELEAWLGHIQRIRPDLVMLYSIERDTPEQNLEKVGREEMESIGSQLTKLNIPWEVY